MKPTGGRRPKGPGADTAEKNRYRKMSHAGRKIVGPGEANLHALRTNFGRVNERKPEGGRIPTQDVIHVHPVSSSQVRRDIPAAASTFEPGRNTSANLQDRARRQALGRQQEQTTDAFLNAADNLFAQSKEKSRQRAIREQQAQTGQQFMDAFDNLGQSRERKRRKSIGKQQERTGEQFLDAFNRLTQGGPRKDASAAKPAPGGKSRSIEESRRFIDQIQKARQQKKDPGLQRKGEIFNSNPSLLDQTIARKQKSNFLTWTTEKFRKYTGKQNVRSAVENALAKVPTTQHNILVVPDSLKTLQSVKEYARLLQAKANEKGSSKKNMLKSADGRTLSLGDINKLVGLKTLENHIKELELKLTQSSYELRAETFSKDSYGKMRAGREKITAGERLKRLFNGGNITSRTFRLRRGMTDEDILQKEGEISDLTGAINRNASRLKFEMDQPESKRIIETYSKIRADGEREVLNRTRTVNLNTPEGRAEFERARTQKIREQKKLVSGK
ncbi:MAG: hypothetical protein NUV67_04875 [archaeon]|nr:hypothetical protein [archaeon]